jgi:hypothetical protein
LQGPVTISLSAHAETAGPRVLKQVSPHTFQKHLNKRKETLGQAVTYETEITKTATVRLWLPVIIFLATSASSSQTASSPAEIKPRDLNLILQRLEDIQH